MFNQAVDGRGKMRAHLGSGTRRGMVRVAVAEVLESRRMLSGAVVPTLHPIDFAGAQRRAAGTGGVSASAVYGGLNTIGKSTNGAAIAVAAKGLSPFSVNGQGMRQALAGAPLETAVGAAGRAVVFPVPMPDGTISRFKVVEAPIMEAGLAAKFPDIKTYRGIGIDDPTASLRLDYTPLGMHAQVLSVNGSYYIDPFFRNDAAGTYASYYKRDVVSTDVWKCNVIENGAAPLSAKQEAALDAIFADSLAAGPGTNAIAFGTQLKTYRLAVAADGEYVAAVGGGTVSGGQAAVVTAVNRVTGVYETELDVRLVLVANNSSLIYTNSSTDPYTNSNPNSLLTQNQSNIDSVIGNANYDIGHVFSTGGGGLAALGVVGKTGSKAQAETGNSSPTGDSYWIDYVAHEMGHQFGANHTFNTSSDTNINPGTAYEPGSGSTIMAYAGIEGSEDLQAHSDPYFHSASIDEIRSYITTGTIANVGALSNTGNNAPTVSAGLAYTIPTGTPFVLTATGSDVDGDTVTYDWQERDLGAARLLTQADNGSSPILRDWIPTTSASRTVPRLSNLLNNTLAPGEIIPGVARASFKWRVIARDNKAGGGGVSSSDVTLSVVNTGSAFSVTSPNTAVSWFATQTQNVTWNVAGTTANGINTANVNILLSVDGGNTYTFVLASGTANDGSQAITVPTGIDTSTARVKVEAVGNIFFDISNANFAIASSPPPPGTIAGQVYEDRNADGALNGNDVPRNGVVVFLDTNNNGVLDSGINPEPSVITSGLGNFSFGNLNTGTYHLRQQTAAEYVLTAPVSGAVDLAVTSGSTATQNFFDFPIVYVGTSSADNYLVRYSNSGVAGPFYSDNFNRATLAGGSNTYSTGVSAGNGGASVVGSDVLTLTNDATAATNAAGAVFVTTPTSAFPGFNSQLHLNGGVLTWSFNMRQIRPNPSGFTLANYGAAFVLGATNGTLNGTSAANGYAVAIGNSGQTDPIRLVRFSGGLNGTLTTIVQDAGQDATSDYWSVKVTYSPANDQWQLFTRDDGTSAFVDPMTGGAFVQSGGAVADSTYTSTPLTHVGAYWSYSTQASQTASFDNFVFTAPIATPKIEILVGGVVTYSAPPTLPPSLAFNLGDGADVFSVDSTGGAIPVPVSFNGEGGSDTWRFVGGTQTFNVDASAFAENVDLVSGAAVTFNATQRLNALTVDASSRAVVGANGSRVLRLNTLSIAAGGTVDLNDNDLVVANGSFSALQALVLAGYSASADSSKTGIISSTSQNVHGGTTILALFDNSLGGFSEYPTGSGETIGANAIVGKYTYIGDTNMDGQVTPQDYTATDSNLGTSVDVGISWFYGDTNFDGNIDASDYAGIDGALGLGIGSPLAFIGSPAALAKRSQWDDFSS
jgi:hypothetical protein